MTRSASWPPSSTAKEMTLSSGTCASSIWFHSARGIKEMINRCPVAPARYLFGSAQVSELVSKLNIHVAIGAGMVYGYHVGGVGAKWEYLIDGPGAYSRPREGAASTCQPLLCSALLCSALLCSALLCKHGLSSNTMALTTSGLCHSDGAGAFGRRRRWSRRGSAVRRGLRAHPGPQHEVLQAEVQKTTRKTCHESLHSALVRSRSSPPPSSTAGVCH